MPTDQDHVYALSLPQLRCSFALPLLFVLLDIAVKRYPSIHEILQNDGAVSAEIESQTQLGIKGIRQSVLEPWCPVKLEMQRPLQQKGRYLHQHRIEWKRSRHPARGDESIPTIIGRSRAVIDPRSPLLRLKIGKRAISVARSSRAPQKER